MNTSACSVDAIRFAHDFRYVRFHTDAGFVFVLFIAG
jgi:hypothetical protein